MFSLSPLAATLTLDLFCKSPTLDVRRVWSLYNQLTSSVRMTVLTKSFFFETKDWPWQTHGLGALRRPLICQYLWSTKPPTKSSSQSSTESLATSSTKSSNKFSSTSSTKPLRTKPSSNGNQSQLDLQKNQPHSPANFRVDAIMPAQPKPGFPGCRGSL